MKSLTILTVTLILSLSSCREAKTTDSTKTQDTVGSSTSTTLKVKVDVFNDIEKTRSLLSSNGIGELHSWRSDEMGGFMSITDYFQFGDDLNSPQNNLAYYLESDNEHVIKTAKLILSIHNKREKKQALTKFKDLVELTFRSLSLEIPDGVFDALRREKKFEAMNDRFMTSLKLDRSKIDTWKLIIETK